MRRYRSCYGCCWAPVGKGYLCVQLLDVAEGMITWEELDSAQMVVCILSARKGLAQAGQEKLMLMSLNQTRRCTWIYYWQYTGY
jgi:hypothetical protein